MNMKKRILTTLAIVFIVLCGYILVDYTSWKQETISRLQKTSSTAETSHGSIEYTSTGKGPAVLLIHGTPGGYDQGMLLTKILNSQEFTFIALSRPGYLRTPLSVGKTPEEQADAYAALLDELKIQSAYILAMSGGGPSALQFTLRHPDRCQGLILISAITQAPEPMTLSPSQQAFQNVMENVLTSDFGNWILYKLIRAIPTAGLPQDPEIRLPDAKQEEIFQELYDTLFPVSLRIEGINNDTEQFNNMPAFPFSEIKVPTLVMHGTNDRNVPFETAEFAASNIPDSEFVEIEGGAHEFFLIVQRQDAFTREIIAFLKNNQHSE
jgi:pimeloyl-ACP methyl ester carboxylesterase